MFFIIVANAQGKWREEHGCKSSEPSNGSVPFMSGTYCAIDISELSGHGLEEVALRLDKTRPVQYKRCKLRGWAWLTRSGSGGIWLATPGSVRAGPDSASMPSLGFREVNDSAVLFDPLAVVLQQHTY